MQKISLQQHKQHLLVCAVEMAGYVLVAKYCLILITSTLKAGSVIIVYIKHTHTSLVIHAVRPWVLEKCELDAANGYYYCCHCAICNFNGMAAAFAEREAPSFLY
jgi:hypothetical protein